MRPSPSRAEAIRRKGSGPAAPCCIQRRQARAPLLALKKAPEGGMRNMASMLETSPDEHAFQLTCRCMLRLAVDYAAKQIEREHRHAYRDEVYPTPTSCTRRHMDPWIKLSFWA